MTNWALPVLLAVAQLAVWPGTAPARGDEVTAGRLAVVVAAVVVVTVALGFRARVPVPVTAIVAVVAAVGGRLVPEVALFVPGDALLVLSFAELIALFSVSARCSRRVTALTAGGLVAWQGVLLLDDGPIRDLPLDLLINAVIYGVVAAAGRARGRWVAERSAAARRLAEAERDRREAAGAERRRLARELHDVTAHHLTSIVVNASTARFLGAQRPELVTESLEFAARTGRQALVDLRQLVTLIPQGEGLPGPPVPTLSDLADDFRQLGQVVVADVDVAVGAATAEVVHAIAREALTNTLRYAPGATVRLSLTQDAAGTRLLVEDGGPAGESSAGGLGGGRGVTGMRERAASLGGTVSAGPRQPHGWRVHAVLPPAASAPAGNRMRRWVRSRVVLDAGLVALTLVVPLSGLAAYVTEDRPAPAAATLALLAMIAHAVPLLWRRRRPWTVLGVLAATAGLGPLLTATSVVPADDGWLFLFSGGAELVAVHAVAAYGARPRLTWLAAVAGLTSTVLVLGLLFAMQPTDADRMSTVVVAVVLAMLAAVVLAAPFAGCWLTGAAARRRRERRAAREEAAVATVAAQAEQRALAERARVAAGLRDAVLRHAARVPQAADEGDLATVLEAAREALAAMRLMLDGLGPVDRRTMEVSSSPSA
ncbi:sensor histidine kinase [Actinoplanes sp. DH11]|uniref:sensor histidine kinase n=1 Tax=Actinoplanes sp. DH11 TaxID=2857011 RepID=UPI001E4DA4EB|nr:histidine kinase [Actinoplanes sp. DH11]